MEAVKIQFISPSTFDTSIYFYMSRHIMWRLLAQSSLNSLIWLVGFLGLLHTAVLWLCFVWSDNKGVKESICLYFHTEVYFTYKSDRKKLQHVCLDSVCLEVFSPTSFASRRDHLHNHGAQQSLCASPGGRVATY